MMNKLVVYVLAALTVLSGVFADTVSPGVKAWFADQQVQTSSGVGTGTLIGFVVVVFVIYWFFIKKRG